MSGDPSYIDDEGHILQRGKKIYEVYFTYYISIESYQFEYEKMFKLSPKTLEDAQEKFLAQFPISAFISKDIDVQTTFFDVFTVTWWSSNQEVFSNEGKYTKLLEDSKIIISYIITDGTKSIEDNFEIKVQGKTAYDYFVEATEFMETGIFQELYLTSDLVLPTTVATNDKIKISWSSSNENIISSTGKVTQTMYERFCKLTARLEMDGSSSSTFEYNFVIAAKDISQMSKEEMLDEFLANIAVEEYKRVSFLTYTNNTQSYGFINFYGTKKLNLKEGLIKQGAENRPGYIKTSVEYITVHDTANQGSTADATMHYNYITGGSSGTTSWHYSVDQDVVYRHIPDQEVAWHAGDNMRKFATVDTGIKATAKMPIVTLKDGYYCLNGQKTKLRPYEDNAGTVFDKTNYTTSKINQMGVLVEVGANGNWYMGKTYLNSSYNLIGNFGGNFNSIGIESCVNAGSDYATTVRHLALLVAKLCVENNLPVTRVQGHHYFSGKGCPNQLMNGNYWEEFKNLVALEIFAMEHFSDYTFDWTSLSSSVDSTGKIAKTAKAGDVIQYSVVVKNSAKAVVKSATYSTVLK